jgi:hypothetical protein
MRTSTRSSNAPVAQHERTTHSDAGNAEINGLQPLAYFARVFAD